MKPRHAAALALASAYLSGCLPVPWVYHTRPDVDGEVMQNHAPVGAARVRYSLNNSDENCDSYESYTARSRSRLKVLVHLSMRAGWTHWAPSQSWTERIGSKSEK